MRKFIASAAVVLFAFTLAVADETNALITKFEDGKITVTKKGKGKDAKAEEFTLMVAADAKFRKAKFSFDKETMKAKFEDDGEYEGGKEAFAKAVKEAKEKADKAKDDPDKKKKGGLFGGGVFATIVTDGEFKNDAKVTEIRALVFKGFGK
jgi:hypothetical protein